MIIWPKPFTGGSAFEVWLNKLLAAAKACELKNGVGYNVTNSTNGKTLSIDSSGGSADSWPPRLYDETKNYSAGDWIWVKPSSSAVTTGLRDLATGDIVQASAGLYRARVAISPGTVTVSGSPVAAYYIPQRPEPDTDDITASAVKWIYFRGEAAC